MFHNVVGTIKRGKIYIREILFHNVPLRSKETAKEIYILHEVNSMQTFGDKINHYKKRIR